MKTRKALKRLGEVESLLTDVIKQLTGDHAGVKEMLSAAEANVARAVKLLDAPDSQDVPRKTAPKKAASTKKKAAPAKRKSVPKKA